MDLGVVKDIEGSSPRTQDNATDTGEAALLERCKEKYVQDGDDVTQRQKSNADRVSISSEVDLTQVHLEDAEHSINCITNDHRTSSGDDGSSKTVQSATENAPSSSSSKERTISSQPQSPSISSVSNDGETDQERGSETNGHEQGEVGPGRGNLAVDSKDLPSQLHRIWGASPPGRADKLSVMRDMLEHREELDKILSRLVVAKV